MNPLFQTVWKRGFRYTVGIVLVVWFERGACDIIKLLTQNHSIDIFRCWNPVTEVQYLKFTY